MIKWPQSGKNKIRNGKWKEFNKHATLIAEGWYVNGMKHGPWREYYDDTGSLMIEENYRNGIQHGRYAAYHPNGQLLSEGEFYNGSRHGHFQVYDEHGNNIRSLFFVNDVQVADTQDPMPSPGHRKPKPGLDYALIFVVLVFWITVALQVWR